MKPSGITALVSCILIAMVNGILYTWSVFILPFEKATGWTRPELSLVFTFILIFFGLGMMCGGPVVRKIGLRKTLILGGSMLVIGLLISSVVTASWQLVGAYGICAGFGIGMVNIIPSAVALAWYPQKRGLACGIVTFALAMGTLIFGSIFATHFIQSSGVYNTLRYLAFTAAILYCVALLPLTYPETNKSSSAVIFDDGSLTAMQMFRTSLYWKCWLWASILQIGGLMIVGHIFPYAVQLGLTEAQAGIIMGGYAIANGVGRLIFGSIFDAKGYRYAMLLDVICMVGGLLVIAILPNLFVFAGTLLGAIIIGISYGGNVPQFSAFIAQNFGKNYLENKIGTTATSLILPGIIGPMLGAYIQQATGSYTIAIFVAAAIIVSAAFFIIAMPKPVKK